VASNAAGRHHTVNLVDAEACSALVKLTRPDKVFHLASHVSGRQDLATVRLTFDGNLCTTVNLLSALHDVGSASAIVIAGSSEEPRNFAHDDQATYPSSPYAAAKLSAAAYASFFRTTLGLPVVHARIFMVYGPGQRDLAKLVPYVAVSLLRGLKPRLSSGKRRADWVHVDDVVSGLLCAGQRPDLTTLDLGTGTLTSVAQVAQILREAISPDAPLGLGELPDRVNETALAADIRRSECLSGWKPGWTLAEGLRSTAGWYRSRLSEFPEAA
jgi:nucleoside-diphosphate-sugar epimerase